MLKKHLREHDFPVSATERLESICLTALPVVEVTDKVYLGCIRSPLTEHPVSLIVTVHTVEYMIVDALGQGTVHRISVLKFQNHLIATVNDILVRQEPLISVINHLCLLFCTHIIFILFIYYTVALSQKNRDFFVKVCLKTSISAQNPDSLTKNQAIFRQSASKYLLHPSRFRQNDIASATKILTTLGYEFLRTFHVLVYIINSGLRVFYL